MYDLSFFRQNLDAIATRLADRGFTLDVDAFRQLDAERRAALTESEQLKALRKTESQEIGKLIKGWSGRERNASRRFAKWATAPPRSKNARKSSTTSTASCWPGFPTRPTPRCPPAEAPTIMSKCAAGARRPRFLSRPRPIGISAPNSASWISSAPLKSPERASPSTGAWARSSNALSSTSCWMCTPSTMATPKCCRRSWPTPPASTAPASCRSSRRICSSSRAPITI